MQNSCPGHGAALFCFCTQSGFLMVPPVSLSFPLCFMVVLQERPGLLELKIVASGLGSGVIHLTAASGVCKSCIRFISFMVQALWEVPVPCTVLRTCLINIY